MPHRSSDVHDRPLQSTIRSGVDLWVDMEITGITERLCSRVADGLGFEPSVPPWLGAFTPSKTSMSGSVGVGGFEKGEFEGNSATEKVAAQIGVRGPIRSNSARRKSLLGVTRPQQR
jgi:hypothetical protein